MAIKNTHWAATFKLVLNYFAKLSPQMLSWILKFVISSKIKGLDRGSKLSLQIFDWILKLWFAFLELSYFAEFDIKVSPVTFRCRIQTLAFKVMRLLILTVARDKEAFYYCYNGWFRYDYYSKKKDDEHARNALICTRDGYRIHKWYLT